MSLDAQNWIDIARVFVLMQGLFVAVAAFVIWVRYVYLVIRTPREPMPWHVALISVSYLMGTVFIALEVIGRIGQPLSYRMPMAGIIFLTGDLALCFMLTHLYSHRFYAPRLRERLQHEMKQN